MTRLGALLCGHCNQMHRSSEQCNCEGARAERTKWLDDALRNAKTPPAPLLDEAIYLAEYGSANGRERGFYARVRDLLQRTPAFVKMAHGVKGGCCVDIPPCFNNEDHWDKNKRGQMTLTTLRRRNDNRRRGWRPDQCQGDAHYLIDGKQHCATHAGQLALNHMLTVSQ